MEEDEFDDSHNRGEGEDVIGSELSDAESSSHDDESSTTEIEGLGDEEGGDEVRVGIY